MTDAPGAQTVSARPTLVIIDGHALAFRSYFAIRELSNSKGEATNAIFGFVRALLRMLTEESEHDATIVTFDAPAKTFRHEQYEAYKAGRAETPADLITQIGRIKQIVELLGVHQCEQAGLEADDLIGTLATRAARQGYNVEIITSDRDSYQLISEEIKVRGLSKDDILDADAIFEKYGVRVEQWVDYRALTGDSSDNIPGAKGIGPKTASKLLQAYGSLDAIIDALPDVKPASAAKKVADSLEDVKFSRVLSRIVTDADIPCTPEVWATRDVKRGALAAVFEELEFGSFIRELNLKETQDATLTYEEVTAANVPKGGVLGFVLKGVGYGSTLEALAIAGDSKVATVTPDALAPEALSKLDAVDAKALAVALSIGHLGPTPVPGDDPLLMAYALDTNNTDIEAICRRYGAPEWGSTAQSRAVASAELLKLLSAQLEGDRLRLYEDIERPLAAVLADMERVGVKLDAALLASQSKDLAGQLQTIEQQIRSVAEDPQLNINSRDQLATLLFDKLKLQAGRKTATGKRSTAVSALEPLREEHPVVEQILNYRELAKLRSTYLEPLPKLLNPASGRLHTTFHQTNTATGRLASINPNLQNIPVRTELGREIRRGFIADDGMMLLVADYSQIELRILAHISQEDALIETFRREDDIHRLTASQINHVALEDVTPTMRRVAKIINFGVLYGMSAHRLTRELNILYPEAEAYIQTYFKQYPGVQRYIESTIAFAQENGYVETLLGRRRSIPDIKSSNRNAREYAERTAYNMPIQGTQADIVKIAMIELAPQLSPLGAKLLLQVHDELVIEVPTQRLEPAKHLVKEVMEGAYKLDVPLTAEVNVGKNWLEAK